MAPPSHQTLSPSDAQLASMLAAASGPQFTPPALLNPNYVPPDRGPAIVAVAVVSITLVAVVVLLRLYLRFGRKKQRPHLDDYFIIPAALLAIGATITAILQVELAGLGKHIYDVPFLPLMRLLRIGFAQTVMFHFAAFFVKLSILMFVRRLYASQASNRINWVFTAYIIGHVVYYVAAFILLFVQCSPVAANWDFRLLLEDIHVKCANRAKLGVALSSINAVSDILLLALPIIKILPLQIPQRTKIGIVILLGLGGLSCVFALWRFALICIPVHYVDITWLGGIATILTCLEINLAIITASLPAANNLFKTMLPEQWRSKQDYSLGPTTNMNIYDSTSTKEKKTQILSSSSTV